MSGTFEDIRSIKSRHVQVNDALALESWQVKNVEKEMVTCHQSGLGNTEDGSLLCTGFLPVTSSQAIEITVVGCRTQCWK